MSTIKAQIISTAQATPLTVTAVPCQPEDVFGLGGRGCQRCAKQPATVWWLEEAQLVSLALSHGLATPYCAHCALVAQLAFAERLAATIPELRAELAKLEEVVS